VSSLVVDPQTLAASGAVKATIANDGTGSASVPFTVAIFEDRNANAAYDADTDTLLGSATQPGLAAGASAAVTASVSGTVAFAGDFLYAFVDSEGVVAESNEGNNVRDSRPPSGSQVPPGPVFGTVGWSWTPPTLPLSMNVGGTPAVVDLNADGIPDIVFASF